MRTDTKRTYEKRIEALEGLLTAAQERANRKAARARVWEDNYNRLHAARRQGEEARSWAIEQALRTGNNNVVATARQIADYVFGPDTEADREAETS